MNNLIMVLLISAAAATSLFAQSVEKDKAAAEAAREPAAAMVPFVMPMLSPPGEAVDMRRILPQMPKGEALLPIVVRDGHFYAGESRVRFWGVNLCFAACFPEHEMADKLAARLAGFGINAVRLHHMDYHAFPSGIWKRDFSGLSPEALDRLDYLLAAFKREGIYVNLNLHVSRDFSRTGSDISADRLPQFGKAVCTFHPQLIELQKQYARDLLGHRNAYTGLIYAEDPVIAIVEISNENSVNLILSGYAALGLDSEFETMITERWNKWLHDRYDGDEAALRTAWQRGSVAAGPELLKSVPQPMADAIDRDWLVRPLEGAAMTVKVVPGPLVNEESPEIPPGQPMRYLAINIAKITDVSWHLQLMQPGIALQKGRFYTVRFRACSDAPRSVAIGVQQHDDPYANLGLSSEVSTDAQWRYYELGFTATADEANARLTFVLGKSDVNLDLADFSMTPGGRLGLRADESLAAGTIRRNMRHDITSIGRASDFMRFLADVDADFFGGMRNFLRDELGVRAAITGSETFTLTGDYVHARHMDLVAAHAYWDHPSFPRRPWDPKDWVIQNRPMVDSPTGEHSTIARLTHDRFIRADADGPARPFSVMEWNNASPNETAAEGIPMIAAIAALQDWDGVFLFAYSHSGDWNTAAARSFFDIQGNPLKMAQMAAGALIFRRHDIEALPMTVLTGLPPDRLFDLAARHGAWNNSIFGSDSGHLQAPIEVRLFAKYGIVGHEIHPKKTTAVMQELPPELPEAHKPKSKTVALGSADGRLSWSSLGTAGSGQFAAGGERAATFAGFGRDAPVVVGPLTVQLPTGHFAAITVNSLTPQLLERSARFLITACGKLENTGQRWNEARTSVGDDWGKAPTLIQPVRADITLRTDVHDVLARLTALDGAGKPAAEFDLGAVKNGRISFSLPTEAGTIWYLLELRPIEE